MCEFRTKGGLPKKENDMFWYGHICQTKFLFAHFYLPNNEFVNALSTYTNLRIVIMARIKHW